MTSTRTVSPSEREVLCLALIDSHPGLWSAPRIARGLGVSPATARRAVRRLVAAGRVREIRGTQGPLYFRVLCAADDEGGKVILLRPPG